MSVVGMSSPLLDIVNLLFQWTCDVAAGGARYKIYTVYGMARTHQEERWKIIRQRHRCIIPYHTTHKIRSFHFVGQHHCRDVFFKYKESSEKTNKRSSDCRMDG